MIKIGFIGLGGMGRYQANSFKSLSECKVIAGSDPSGTARADFARIAPGAAVYIDYKDLLNDKNVDAVVVAVPTGHHKQIVIDALAAGRPVLVEKPMARTVAECKQMIDAADKASKLLMVAHCRRYDVDWGVFAKSYRAGQLGEQVLWRDVRAGLGPRSAWFMDDALSGGPLMDGAIHNQDFANWLWGSPDSVVGSAIKMDPKCTAIDTASAIIRYRNGCQLLLSWSWAVPGQTLHDVLGPSATFVFGTMGVTLPEGAKGHTLITPGSGEAGVGEHQVLKFEPQDMYLTQGQHFIDCLNSRTRCQTPGEEAMKAVAVSEAVLKACRENSVVRIAW
jgi:predicted dehydrogenase